MKTMKTIKTMKAFVLTFSPSSASSGTIHQVPLPAERFTKFRFQRNDSPFYKGFTFIETLVAIAVLVLLAAVIVSGLAGFRETAGLDQAVDETIELLRDARSRTLGSENAASYGVHFAPTSVTMFTGGAWNASDPSNVVVALPSAVRISSIALSTTTASVVFERLTGEAAAAGTIGFITLRSGKTAGVRIFSSGLFSKL